MTTLTRKLRREILQRWKKFSRSEEFDIYVASNIAQEVDWRLKSGYEFNESAVIDNTVAYALLLLVKAKH